MVEVVSGSSSGALLVLSASWQRNVVLLVKLKDATRVVDVNRLLGENGIYYRVWEVD